LNKNALAPRRDESARSRGTTRIGSTAHLFCQQLQMSDWLPL